MKDIQPQTHTDVVKSVFVCVGLCVSVANEEWKKFHLNEALSTFKKELVNEGLGVYNVLQIDTLEVPYE